MYSISPLIESAFVNAFVQIVYEAKGNDYRYLINHFLFRYTLDAIDSGIYHIKILQEDNRSEELLTFLRNEKNDFPLHKPQYNKERLIERIVSEIFSDKNPMLDKYQLRNHRQEYLNHFQNPQTFEGKVFPICLEEYGTIFQKWVDIVNNGNSALAPSIRFESSERKLRISQTDVNTANHLEEIFKSKKLQIGKDLLSRIDHIGLSNAENEWTGTGVEAAALVHALVLNKNELLIPISIKDVALSVMKTFNIPFSQYETVRAHTKDTEDHYSRFGLGNPPNPSMGEE